jgi:hypothetical protein
MKKNLRVLSYLAFFAFCIIMVIKEFDAMEKQQEIISEISYLGGIRIINDFALLQPQPLLVLALWSTMIVLLISALILSAEKKFKPACCQEYEILKKIGDGNYHILVLGYYDKKNSYRSETIEWCGMAVFEPKEMYLEKYPLKKEGSLPANTFFIEKIEDGFKFTSVTNFTEAFNKKEA